MDKKDFLDKLTQIGTIESDEERRVLLAEIHAESEQLYDSAEKLSATNKKLAEDMESLRTANMKLFLQVGEQKSPEQKLKDSTGIHNEPPKAKLTFENLFNEKGELK